MNIHRCTSRLGALCLLLVIVSIIGTGCGVEHNTFFYKVTSKDGKKTGYLLGSIHVGKKSFYPFPKAIMDAFGASKALALEIPLDKESHKNSSAYQAFLKLRQPADDPSFSGIENSSTKEKLKLFCKKNQLDYDKLIRHRPFMIVAAIQSVGFTKAKFTFEDGIDRTFANLAKERKIPIVGLEDIDAHYKLAQQIFLHQDESTVANLLANPDAVSKGVELMWKLWKNGDEQSLFYMTYGPFGHSFPLLDLLGVKTNDLLEKRNEIQAEGIVKFLQNKDKLFAIVGAGHLVGEQSVQKLLVKKGFTVEPIKYKFTKPIP